MFILGAIVNLLTYLQAFAGTGRIVNGQAGLSGAGNSSLLEDLRPPPGQAEVLLVQVQPKFKRDGPAVQIPRAHCVFTPCNGLAPLVTPSCPAGDEMVTMHTGKRHMTDCEWVTPGFYKVAKIEPFWLERIGP